METSKHEAPPLNIIINGAQVDNTTMTEVVQIGT